ncbi:nuclear transport factor 2 family protein [Rhodococcus sp. IEGM 1381]|uniref:nuclear transport factor 2 family protein n=1 Tax=Rhodococcus sp. IEGM 1381 TaxID=3047085 RepID=UPI0024B79AA1|nr:nuclear transport factor 2 family protein [Rhodococcus sp. IEGM 1381]MDI9894539.1 nuclear transport factor 2 family protein [Rhodococcus sp. IEGM 1381]
MTTASTKNVKIVPTADYDEIVSVVAHYENGLEAGNWDTITKAFDDDAIMYGYTGDDLTSGTYKNLEAYVQQFGAAPNGHTRVDILGITPTSAVVRIDMEGAADGTSYTDFHTLLKKDGRWTIIAKVFHQYEG